jgi:hypothetical protein
LNFKGILNEADGIIISRCAVCCEWHRPATHFWQQIAIIIMLSCCLLALPLLMLMPLLLLLSQW